MCGCSTNNCGGSCGNLTVNPGIPGKTGVGISSMTQVGNTIQVILTNNTMETFTLPVGADGASIDHISYISVEDSVAGVAGATDTYTAYLDVDELLPVGTFVVYNGADGDGQLIENVGSGTELLLTALDPEDPDQIRSIISETLTLQIAQDDTLKINYFNSPVYKEIPFNFADTTFVVAMDLYAENRIVEVTNRTNKLLSVQLPVNMILEQHSMKRSATLFYILPKASVTLWWTQKGDNKYVTILSYSSAVYEEELIDYQNSFQEDTEKIYGRLSNDDTVTVLGQFRYNFNSPISDAGIFMHIPSFLRPSRPIHFTGRGIINGNASTVASLNSQTNFTIYFTATPSGALVITGIDAPLGTVSPTVFFPNEDVKFIKTYISSIKFSANWDAALSNTTSETNPDV